MKEYEYYIIHGWQRNQLGLRGKELQIYAIIYGYSQDGHNWYQGTAEMLGDRIDCGKRCVFTILKALTKKGLIEKNPVREGRSTYVDYRAVMDKIPECVRPESRGSRRKDQLADASKTEPSSPVHDDLRSPSSPVHDDLRSPSSPVHDDLRSPSSPVHDDLRSPPKDKDFKDKDFKDKTPTPERPTADLGVAEKQKEGLAQKKVFEKGKSPSATEVQAYFAEKRYTRSHQEFFAYNQERGWRKGGHPVRNWKTLADYYETLKNTRSNYALPNQPGNRKGHHVAESRESMEAKMAAEKHYQGMSMSEIIAAMAQRRA